MIVTVHQPNFLPRLKVLQKLALADLWIVLDDVQFAQRDYQHRTFLYPEAKSQPPRWCTLSVHRPNGRTTTIKDIEFATSSPISHVERTLFACFPQASELSRLLPRLRQAVEDVGGLTCLGIASTAYLLAEAHIHTPVVRASELRRRASPSTAGVIELCQLVGATAYLADSGGTRYLDSTAFERAELSLLWQIWSAPPVELPGSVLRNGSGVNLWLRDVDQFRGVLRQCLVSRDRELAVQQ